MAEHFEQNSGIAPPAVASVLCLHIKSGLLDDHVWVWNGPIELPVMFTPEFLEANAGLIDSLPWRLERIGEAQVSDSPLEGSRVVLYRRAE